MNKCAWCSAATFSVRAWMEMSMVSGDVWYMFLWKNT